MRVGCHPRFDFIPEPRPSRARPHLTSVEEEKSVEAPALSMMPARAFLGGPEEPDAVFPGRLGACGALFSRPSRCLKGRGPFENTGRELAQMKVLGEPQGLHRSWLFHGTLVIALFIATSPWASSPSGAAQAGELPTVAWRGLAGTSRAVRPQRGSGAATASDALWNE